MKCVQVLRKFTDDGNLFLPFKLVILQRRWDVTVMSDLVTAMSCVSVQADSMAISNSHLL